MDIILYSNICTVIEPDLILITVREIGTKQNMECRDKYRCENRQYIFFHKIYV